MKIKLEYFAIIREITGIREEIVELPSESTVLDLLKVLAQKHGEKFRDYVLDTASGVPRQNLQYLLNQETILKQNGFGTKLNEGAVFAIIPPVGGG